MKLAAGCCCLLILLKLMGRCNCGGKNCDVRRFRCWARCLYRTGWDEFEAFNSTITVHTVKDVLDRSMVGKSEFFVKVSFRWSVFQTAPTKDFTWEQTKGLPVPQGASSCQIGLFSQGKWSCKKIGSLKLDTLHDMLNKTEAFWGEKQSLKLENKGKTVATLQITFRKRDVADGGDSVGGASFFPGLAEDSALNLQLQKEYHEAVAIGEKPNGPDGQFSSEQKLTLLANVLSGPLREINRKGKELGKIYVRVLYLNFAQLRGEERGEELKRQVEKMKKKGLSQLERKWYWCWYEDKKTPKDKPDGFLPFVAISSIHCYPERQDQFMIKYSQEGEPDSLIYRRESGKGLDVWTDGLELLVKEVRKTHKDKKRDEEKSERSYQQLRQAAQVWVKQHGVPKDQAAWKNWFEHLKSQGFGDEEIQRLYQEAKGGKRSK